MGRRKKRERRGEDGERGNERGERKRGSREERIKERQRETVFSRKDTTQRQDRLHSISLRRKMTEREERNEHKEKSPYKTENKERRRCATFPSSLPSAYSNKLHICRRNLRIIVSYSTRPLAYQNLNSHN